MKMLGIHELISEYEDRCDKVSARKKNNNPGQIRNRYASLLDFDIKKKDIRDVANTYNNSTTIYGNASTKTSNKIY